MSEIPAIKAVTWNVKDIYYGAIFINDYEDCVFFDAHDEMDIMNAVLQEANDMGYAFAEIVDLGGRGKVVPVSVLVSYAQCFSGVRYQCVP